MTREPADRRELAERYGTGEQVPHVHDVNGCIGGCGRADLEAIADEDAELRRIAAETGETLETVRDLHEAMQVCGSEGESEARAERWQRAREAGQDTIGTRDHGIDVAIETATRVRVDADLLHAVREGRQLAMTTKELKSMIEVVFRAAGFEVEQ